VWCIEYRQCGHIASAYQPTCGCVSSCWQRDRPPPPPGSGLPRQQVSRLHRHSSLLLPMTLLPPAGVHAMLMGFMKGLQLPKEKVLPSFAGKQTAAPVPAGRRPV